MIGTAHQVLTQVIILRRMKWHISGGREMHADFWMRPLRERDHLEDINIDGDSKIDLKNRIGICGLDTSGPG